MKKKIVIASVLKPVDDVRMYEKFAQSIIKHFAECEIHILGAKSTMSSYQLSVDREQLRPIYMHEIADFERLSHKRWIYGKIFVETVIVIKPDLLIINSPELLLPSLFIKIKLKIPIIYDVRENYFCNILYQPTYRRWLRLPLALSVRVLEYISRFWITNYLLAEKNYEKEFGFSKGKSEVIENKYNDIKQQSNLESGIWNQMSNKFVTNNQQPTINHRLQTMSNEQKTITYTYTGTISRTYGTIRAIYFIKKINAVLPQSQLLIKGFCSDRDYLDLLKREAQGLGYVKLEITEIPMSHSEIIASFAYADVALLPYLPNKSTENCIPAKMYEYIAHQIPMIVQHNLIWEEVCASCQAAIFIDFNHFEASTLIESLRDKAFYSTGDVSFALWECEEYKFIHLIRSNLFD